MQFHSAQSTTSTLVRRVRSAEDRRPAFSLTARTRIFAIACFLAGASLFIFALLGAIVFQTDRHCGSEFNYYGCDTPTAGVRHEGGQVVREPRTRQRVHARNKESRAEFLNATGACPPSRKRPSAPRQISLLRGASLRRPTARIHEELALARAVRSLRGDDCYLRSGHECNRSSAWSPDFSVLANSRVKRWPATEKPFNSRSRASCIWVYADRPTAPPPALWGRTRGGASRRPAR